MILKDVVKKINFELELQRDERARWERALSQVPADGLFHSELKGKINKCNSTITMLKNLKKES